MYGTWNRLNAVAASMNATSTQSAGDERRSPAGTAKVRMKKTGSSHRAEQHEARAIR